MSVQSATLNQRSERHTPESCGPVSLDEVLFLDAFEHSRNIDCGFFEQFNANDAFEDCVDFGLAAAQHSARAVDEEDALEQRDVAPHFGLPRNRRSFAHLVTSQGR